MNIEAKPASRWLVSHAMAAGPSRRTRHRGGGRLVLSAGDETRRARGISRRAIFPARCVSTSTRSPIIRPICRICCRRRKPSPRRCEQLGIGDGLTIVVYDGIGSVLGAAGLVDVPHLRRARRLHSRRRHAEMEGGRPPDRVRRNQAHAAPFHARFNRGAVADVDDVQKALAHPDMPGGRCAPRRPLSRHSAGAAAGRCDPAICRARSTCPSTAARGRPPDRTADASRRNSPTPASISTSRW